MFSSSRWAGIAGLTILLAGGCSNDAAPASQPAPSSGVGQQPVRSWQAFSPGCPALTAPPYGVAAKGKRITSSVAAGEREALDKAVPGATFDEVTCEYTAPGKVSPLVIADVK